LVGSLFIRHLWRKFVCDILTRKLFRITIKCEIQ